MNPATITMNAHAQDLMVKDELLLSTLSAFALAHFTLIEILDGINLRRTVCRSYQ
jgi:hypothetical protein